MQDTFITNNTTKNKSIKNAVNSSNQFKDINIKPKPINSKPNEQVKIEKDNNNNNNKSSLSNILKTEEDNVIIKTENNNVN